MVYGEGLSDDIPLMGRSNVRERGSNGLLFAKRSGEHLLRLHIELHIVQVAVQSTFALHQLIMSA